MSIEDIFGEVGIQYPTKDNFEWHELVLYLPAGEGERVAFKVKCLGVEEDKCPCTSNICSMQDFIDSVGLEDCIRASEDIELVTLKARMDWTDPYEPWVDVEEQ